MINKLLAEGRKILVFSQFTSMLDLIEIELEQQDIEFVTLRGDTRDRKTPIKRFQNGEVSLFLLSLKAGGTGLNLTAADTVIHYDLWWNPAVESQATDRAHRIGQDKPVFVYKLIGRGTIEQRILELQARKNLLVQAILNDETNLLAKFNEADVNMLFDPIDVPYITADD
jgi:SNF2 family DNA or RNA helicase